ncbi:protein-associating with the carboxyl-terminal domain of ezrin isoform X1 [Phyllostomus discolor]|uniref:Protein-associating with the carboxyl-terminal domain of ezrin isoform X1 n=2 Tax=Phyllostomus discolor TaxID=89673 RepID=A0A6J2N447_9CHIR|nr:protein-associating with the carboxyl-terminal domain of ezrin isoform X1 [Phyllostomus discolor]XP_035871719.1 protein-associating with the carboxyl-terminal domain of ezrin isoform X1 [Phyllostomus discolor]
MGAESSALQSCALRGPPVTLPSGLAVFPAELRDGRVASVFVCKRESKDKVNKAAKHLKTLRHPCLLRFLSCSLEADGIHLVTERVQPLEAALATLSPAEVCAGIYDVLLALVFLHDRGHLTHNNVCVSSVFVSEDGHWKLGGMETVCRVSEATPEFLRSLQPLRDPACVPPEETAPEFVTLPEAHGHARDAYAFGKLAERLLATLSGQVSADALCSFRQTLHSALLHPAPQRRPALRTLLSHGFFRNDFLEVVNFLKSLTLKSEEEKTEFFKFLLDRVSCLPEELVATRLVPLLLNQLVFAEPVAVRSFLPHLLGPKKDGAPGETPCLLSPALFRARVVPVLLRLFEVHEEHVRLVLLTHLEAYAAHFTREQLRTVVLPQVLLGLRDTSTPIVAITLHSLAVLVSLLGPEVVVGGERTKIFKRTAPGFTKTTDLSPEGDQFTQTSRFPVNGLSDVKHTSSGGEDIPPSPQASEEWPDWSEPEEPGHRTASTPAWPPEPPEAAGSPLQDSGAVAGTQEHVEHGSPGPAGGPGGRAAATPGELQALPTVAPLLTGEAGLLASGRPPKTSPAPSVDDAEQTKPPKGSSQERRPQAPSEWGLGEEFTIHVKKKPGQDPELDWFADMTPDIKPSAAVLVLPELRTGPTGPLEDAVSPGMQFSSKFAAADTTEAESEGWGDAGELSWGDGSW